MANEMLMKDNNKFKQKKKVLEKELEKSEEYINIYSKNKDINELNILKDMHEKETENLKDTINDIDKSINELKDMHEQEIKNLKDQLIFKKKSNQEPESRKRADQEPSALAHCSKELINNIKQLINDLYNNEQITK